MHGIIVPRPYNPSSDKELIYGTWINRIINDQPKKGDYWHENHLEQIEKNTLHTNLNRIIDYIILKPGVIVTMASMIDAPEIIIGYVVYEEDPEGTILHWIYVKEAWRKSGIARYLCPPNIKFVTHLTRPGLSLKRRYGLIYDPFKI